MTPTRFVCRELTTAAEFADSFRLRFEVYRETRGLRRFDSLDADSGLDVEAFDRFSRHIGVFALDDAGTRLVGSVRVVGAEPSPFVGELRDAVGGYPQLRARLDAAPAAPLPVLDYSVERAPIESLVRAAVAANETVVEAGRLVMHPEFRMRSPKEGLRVARDLVEVVTSRFFLATPEDHAIVHVRTMHRSFYEKLGFAPIADGSVHAEARLESVPHITLHGRPDTIPGPARPRLEQVAAALQRSGFVEIGCPATGPTTGASTTPWGEAEVGVRSLFDSILHASVRPIAQGATP